MPLAKTYRLVGFTVLLAATLLLSRLAICQQSEQAETGDVFDQGEFKQAVVGQSRQQVRLLLGDPVEIRRFSKVDQAIWGEEENFWPQIPSGTEVEAWRYSNDRGTLTLYFLPEADAVAFKAFAPKGVVYETH